MPPTTNRVQYIRYDCTGTLLRLGLVSPQPELAHRRLSDYHWATGRWFATSSRQGQLSFPLSAN